MKILKILKNLSYIAICFVSIPVSTSYAQVVSLPPYPFEYDKILIRSLPSILLICILIAGGYFFYKKAKKKK
ncbi:hypothetical protein KC717_05835 [Candidatus Dojkabacteria bacterium]|uniref:Uncharacterized protein n=1 Tax=Candidatus Dojkabacteria bacterium TaxID=2099670 RepID=A0A955RKU4_9BACT|nr:hypothetical protein [Candidatus Dojkabacteria bacterium]